MLHMRVLAELMCNELQKYIFGISESWTWFYIFPIICNHLKLLRYEIIFLFIKSFHKTEHLQINNFILLPINHYGIASLTLIFTSPLSPNWWQASNIWSSWDAYIKLVLLKHHLIHSLMGYTKSFFWCKPMGRYLIPLFSLHLGQPCIFSCSIKSLLRCIGNSSFDCML
jgi:hypothetical protein